MKMFFVLFAILGMAGVVSADRRSYVWTYEYHTMPKGMAEIEYYVNTDVPDTSDSGINTWKHQVELEYGITDRWDVSMYQVFKQNNNDDTSEFEYEGFKVRTRYRLGESGLYPLDTLLYLEWIRNDDFSESNVLEGKLVLAKDIQRINLAYNQIIEQEVDGGKPEHEYAAGASIEISPAFRLGLESKGSYTDDKYYLGPTISWGQEKFWVSLGIAWGLNDRSSDFTSQMILGIPF
jgi:hypothetical protein